jgi:hypothetical protein
MTLQVSIVERLLAVRIYSISRILALTSFADEIATQSPRGSHTSGALGPDQPDDREGARTATMP